MSSPRKWSHGNFAFHCNMARTINWICEQTRPYMIEAYFLGNFLFFRRSQMFLWSSVTPNIEMSEVEISRQGRRKHSLWGENKMRCCTQNLCCWNSILAPISKKLKLCSCWKAAGMSVCFSLLASLLIVRKDEKEKQVRARQDRFIA